MGKTEEFIIEKGWYMDFALREYRGAERHVVVPDGVEEIVSGAFTDCDELETVTLPKTVVAILEGAFCGCKKLRRVEYADQPEYMAEISQFAFVNCSENLMLCACGVLAAVSPDIGELVIPEGVTYIPRRDGWEYERLKRVRFPGSLRRIGENAFRDCDLEDVWLPDGLEELGSGAFCGCVSLEHVRLPPALRSIPDRAFRECGSLRDVLLPNGLREIGDFAFFGCAQPFRALPPRLEKLGRGALARWDWERVPYLLLPPTLETIEDFLWLRDFPDAPAPPLIAPHLPLDAFPEAYRLYALRGLAISRGLGIGIHYPEHTEREYFDYARAHRRELVPAVMRDEALLELLTEELILYRE